MKDFSKEYRESLNYYREYEENEVKSELDSLFDSVKGYRTSQFYRDTLDFCRRFKQLAPFNAMMVKLQRPSCRFVLTAAQWKKMYGRTIIPNARPVVILSFQPVSYLYDISDTEICTCSMNQYRHQQMENITICNIIELSNHYK